MKRLAIIILNYRTPDMTLDCVAAPIQQIDPLRDLIIVVDNRSGDDSVDRIKRAATDRGWIDSGSVRVIESDRNGGFGYGNNVGIRSVEAEFYLLLNSDTIVCDGAIEELLHAADLRPDAGLISPRLQWPGGDGQVSCFRYRSPKTEFLRAAGTGFVTRILGGGEPGLPLSDKPTEPQWTSFAAVLIRREVFEKIGLLDDGYFMYYEDIDFCRRARDAGFTILNWPAARVVHLCGGTSSAVEDSRAGRPPRYVYESRARYFSRYYGLPGLWLTNLLWQLGAVVRIARSIIGRRNNPLNRREWLDNWIGAFTCSTPPEGPAHKPSTQVETRHSSEVIDAPA